MQDGARASKFGFYKLIECIIKKMSWCETECKNMCHWNVMKLEVFILGGQRIDQMRKKGWWRGRRERIEKRSRERIEKWSRERIEIERKETKGN